MQINETVTGKLPENIAKLIEIALSKEANIKCEVIVVVKPGNQSGSKLTLEINSPVNYDNYPKSIGL